MLRANRGLVITLDRQQFVFDADHDIIRISYRLYNKIEMSCQIIVRLNNVAPPFMREAHRNATFGNQCGEGFHAR